MRFRSWSAKGITVYAVVGVNSVSFGLSVSATARRGLLGFAVQRGRPGEPLQYLTGFKVFRSVLPDPEPGQSVSTREHPIQSLVWDDFTLRPDTEYVYRFTPMRGTPAYPDLSATAAIIEIRTEPLTGAVHDVVFNRGVASSQAYQRRFGGLSPDDQPTAARRQLALDWLSRDLDDTLLGFIRSAGPGDALRGAFYEFSYAPALAELAAAAERGVDVSLVIDMKVNEHWENQKQPDGTTRRRFAKSDPRLDNQTAIAAAGLPASSVIAREARRSAIAHNKFLVLHRSGVPQQVWTGSTNLTRGGIHGQSNLGHLIRDDNLARDFQAYWELLATDPGGRFDDTPSVVRDRNAQFRAAVATLSPAPTQRADVPVGLTPLFSPRASTEPLSLYADLLANPRSLACATLAFGIAKELSDVLAQGDSSSPLRFLLLEKRSASGSTPSVELDSDKNIYQAWGSEIDTPLGQWVVETTTRKLGLNSHVAFIHNKFLLADPLGADPIVVTGSANFSRASCTENDENMVLIRGDRRVADIYFTEFNRLFFHYYFRSVLERIRSRRGGAPDDPRALDLVEDDSWLAKYAPGTLRSKRATQFVTMAGALRSGPRP